MTDTIVLTAPFTILDVVDTRAVEEVDDNVWKPIAGSGIENECGRCNRLHEVHAHVRDANGIEAVVGTGCRNADAGQKKLLRSLAGKARRVATDAAKARAADAARATLAELRALVPPFPADRVEYVPPAVKPSGLLKSARWSVDDVWVLGAPDAGLDGELIPLAADDPERLACLAENWERKHLVRLAEDRGMDLYRLRSRAGEFA